MHRLPFHRTHLTKRLTQNFNPPRRDLHRNASSFFQTRTKFPSNSLGCFGLPHLHSESDWNAIAQKCVMRCEHLASSIRKEERRDASIFRTFDELSNELCVVMDTAELCRNVHPNPAFSRSADEAHLTLSALIQALNADKSLYDQLILIRDSLQSDDLKSLDLDNEDVHMAHSLALDFEIGGILLSSDEKKHIIDLQQRIGRLELALSSVTRKNAVVNLPENIVSSLPKWFRHQVKRTPNAALVAMDSGVMQSIIRNVHNPDHRELIYRNFFNSHASMVLPLLDELISARHQYSKALGYKSYAAMRFEDRLGTSPEEVAEFLCQLSHVLTPQVNKELKSLTGNRKTALAWDYPYLLSRLKEAEGAGQEPDISHFLPLSAVLEGINLVLNKCFAVRMEPEQAGIGELWHTSVQKMRVSTEKDELLGHIFLDFEPRPMKTTQAAHYCIRCGREQGPGMPYQTPVVALVCNFARKSPNGEQLLSFTEYETLWHELGHAMHSLFSRTKYQHLSGTRVPTDSVEIPSHLFENFAWDPLVLSQIGRHYKSSEHIPTRMLYEACGARNEFTAIDLRSQILMSVFDLQIHGENPPVGKTNELYEQLQSQLSPFPSDGVPAYSSFSHLSSYGAGYYSYLFASIISTQLWSTLGFEQDPFSRKAGTVFRDMFLAKGASQLPGMLLEQTLGIKVDCAPFLESIGIEQGSLRLPVKK